MADGRVDSCVELEDLAERSLVVEDVLNESAGSATAPTDHLLVDKSGLGEHDEAVAGLGRALLEDCEVSHRGA